MKLVKESNIDQEIKNQKEGIMGQPETFLFKKDEEKNLFDKIMETNLKIPIKIANFLIKKVIFMMLYFV